MERLSKRSKEADVEVRIVTPLLTGAEFLAIPPVNIKNKAYLYPHRLDKAAGKTTGYYPDFSIWMEALPVFIVEAKAPSVEADVGYLEASQYALHLNRQYRNDLDPCDYIIATNGQRLLAGFWNTQAEIDVPVEDLVPGSAALERLKERVSYGVARQRAAGIRQAIAKDGVYSAMKGSQASALINTKIAPNRFASALIPTLTRYFASPTDDTDPAVYDTGYVPTTEQLSYDAILENLLREKALRHKNPLSKDVLTTRTETKDFSQRIAEYSSHQQNTGQLILVIGHVGAGKSLFIRRYRKLLVPDGLSGDIKWAFLNFNDGSFTLEGADTWVSEKYVESFRQEQTDVDIYSEDMLDHIFGAELNINKAIYAQLERVSELETVKQRMADIKMWKNDYNILSRGLTRYYGGQRGETCIAVFDNVDRMKKDDQLAAFQLALSFMADHRTLTVLQLRDETFERFKDTKPLDTFKTGLSFHIIPPRFASVVRRRLEISIGDLGQSAPKEWEYELGNGARVRISRDQALEFLKEIYEYVFADGVNASRVLQGLAGRNVRRALEIFFRVLISGHLAHEQITSVATGGRAFPITDDLVLRTLMRGDYRFFHNGAGYVKNIYWFDPQWLGADNLTIPEILFFLGMRMKTRGTIGLEGFFTVENIFETLQIMGYPLPVVHAACQWLLSSGLVEADDMSTEELDRRASIRVSSSGFMHIRVLSTRLEYVAACLYEMPYLSAEMAQFVSQTFADSQATGGLSRTRKAQAVQDFRKYLRELNQRREGIAPNLVGLQTGADYLLDHVEIAIAEAIRPMKPLPNPADALDL